jgi:hypothetical protein
MSYWQALTCFDDEAEPGSSRSDPHDPIQSPPITRNQVELMQIDSVSMPELPGLEALGIRPHAVEEILQEILRTH